MSGPERVGDTVRRAVGPNTRLVQAVMLRLEQAGLPWSPRALGVDDEGREVLSWIPGVAASGGRDVDLRELVSMVRTLHDLTGDLAGGHECVIHDDLQPRNVVIRDGHVVGLIDWEQARPGRRVEDVADLCWSFIEPKPQRSAEVIGEQWRHIADLYGFTARDELIATVLARMLKCADDIEREARKGSERHRLLADRGDHHAIRSMQRWVADHDQALRSAVAE